MLNINTTRWNTKNVPYMLGTAPQIRLYDFGAT